MRRPVLYHAPTSYNSQIVRLALREKGVSWKSHVMNIERDHENARPRYLRLNPEGSVPTFTHKDITLTDAITIALYINNNFPGPMLAPSNEKEIKLMEQWVTLAHQFPDRELALGGLSGFGQKLALKNLEKRKSLIQALEEKNEDLSAVYKATYEKTLKLQALIGDSHVRNSAVIRVDQMLEMAEEAVKRSTWLAGDDYSLADICWTIILARLDYLGLKELWTHTRPNLTGYYQRARARPSFRKARIPMKAPKGAHLRDIMNVYGWARAAVWAIIIGFLAAAGWAVWNF